MRAHYVTCKHRFQTILLTSIWSNLNIPIVVRSWNKRFCQLSGSAKEWLHVLELKLCGRDKTVTNGNLNSDPFSQLNHFEFAKEKSLRTLKPFYVTSLRYLVWALSTLFKTIFWQDRSTIFCAWAGRAMKDNSNVAAGAIGFCVSPKRSLKTWVDSSLYIMVALWMALVLIGM